FDELLHIRKGRHYGFPPRHPKHLPTVIDEPSVFDYGPQHQSTCGLCFNEPVKPGGPTFGPAAWAGDAFLTGYSRGKLYRTQLVRGVVRPTKITAGAFVRAGDRFESLWPGYAVVQAQKAAPRYDVPVRSAQLTPDRRTLVLATDPLRAAVHYAVTLPGMGRPAKPGKGERPQQPQIDLDFDLSGCEAA